MSTKKYLKSKKNESVVCIAGAHRSGASMLTRLLHDCGLFLGPESELMPAQTDNPDGFWEHLRFVALNDEVLNTLGGAWDLPPRRQQHQLRPYRWRLQAYLSTVALGQDETSLLSGNGLLGRASI